MGAPPGSPARSSPAWLYTQGRCCEECSSLARADEEAASLSPGADGLLLSPGVSASSDGISVSPGHVHLQLSGFSRKDFYAQPQTRVLGCKFGCRSQPLSWVSCLSSFVFGRDPPCFQRLPGACRALIAHAASRRLDAVFISPPLCEAMHAARTGPGCAARLHVPRVSGAPSREQINCSA